MIGEEPQVAKKKIRLGIHWRDKWIDFCSVCFTSDSFIFSSKFHNQQDTIQIGDALKVEEEFRIHKDTKQYLLSSKSCHLTLHKPIGKDRGVIQLREGNRGEILDSVRLDWFPVQKPFHFLTLYSPPLVDCTFSDRSPNFFSPIASTYENSMQVTVDIFPRNTAEHFPSTSSIWIYWGYCPDYLVRVSFNLLKSNTEALMLWPTGLFNP